MFARVNLFAPVSVFAGAKSFTVTSQRNYKVTVIGAAGGIGQPLSLLLKLNNYVSQLALYDIAPVTPGVAVDISHINTPCRAQGYKGPEELSQALTCASVVIIPAGVPRKPGMKREDLFNTNAGLIRDMSKAIARSCPQAIVGIITNPVNSMVPIAAEVLKKEGAYDPRRVMGVTTLDIVRACTFVGEINCIDPSNVTLPVIGGHSGATIVPLFSQGCPRVNLCNWRDLSELMVKVQDAGTAVVKAKGGGGSATLSMAFAGARFVGAVLKGLAGEQNVVECVYVASGLCEPEYFANPVLLGPCGVARNLGFGCLTPLEIQFLQRAMPELVKDIRSGQQFGTKP